MPDIFVPEKNVDEKIHHEAPPVEPVKGEPEPTKPLRKHIHRFASFCTHPSGISFENQEEDEEILLFLRSHLVTNLPWAIIVIFLIFIPPLLATVLSMINIISFPIPPQFTIIILLFYYLAVVMYAFVEFIGWFYDIGIVTQKRVIDLDYSDIIHHEIALTKLSLVQDINYKQTGLIRSFFNYGDVFIQTAGNEPNFDFLGAPQPGNVVHIIQDLIGKGPHSDI